MTFFSSGGSSGEGGSGVGKILDGLGKIDFSFISGSGTGSEMVTGSSESRGTFSDFVVSEVHFFFTRSLVSSEHGVMFSLFFVDLVFKLVEKSFDVSHWATSLNLGFDLGKEVTEVTTVESVKLSGLDSE